MDINQSGDSLFDSTAKHFASNADRLIARGAYRRGELFAKLAREHIERGGEILDYGCGPGRISRLVALEGFRIHAVDPSVGMLEEARKQDWSGLSATFERLPEETSFLESGRYHGIVCSSTIEYVPDAAALLRTFHRALRPGGVLLISYANRQSLWRRYAEIRFATAPHLALQRHIWTFDQFSAQLRTARFAALKSPVFLEADPFDRRPLLSRLSASRFIGTLGLIVARREGEA